MDALSPTAGYMQPFLSERQLTTAIKAALTLNQLELLLAQHTG